MGDKRVYVGFVGFEGLLGEQLHLDFVVKERESGALWGLGVEELLG